MPSYQLRALFAAAIGSAPVIALWGWRALFVIGLFPAIFAFVIRWGVAEPDKFVQTQQGSTTDDAQSVGPDSPGFGAKIRALWSKTRRP